MRKRQRKKNAKRDGKWRRSARVRTITARLVFRIDDTALRLFGRTVRLWAKSIKSAVGRIP